MITRHGLDDKFIHSSPILCIPKDDIIETWNDLVRCSTNIDNVTCPMCSYYYFYPEARGMEFKYRARY